VTPWPTWMPAGASGHGWRPPGTAGPRCSGSSPRSTRAAATPTSVTRAGSPRRRTGVGRLPPAFACLTGDRSMAPIMLITRLAALAEAVAGLRDAQQHAAQAAAARAAAERLYAAARPAPPAQPRPAQRASTAAQLARLSFPSQPGQLRQDSPVRLQAGRHQSHGRHHQGHAAPPADDATTHSSAHQITALAPESDATAAAAAR
jgi:hypothetical protein